MKRQLGRKPIERDQAPLQTLMRGARPVFLNTPLTHPSFAGTAKSTVGYPPTMIRSQDWSSAIPKNAVALLLRAQARDSGSGGTNGLYFAIHSTSTSTSATLACWLNGTPNDENESETALVPCVNGNVWFMTLASGTGTMDCWLWCFGYWLGAE